MKMLNEIVFTYFVVHKDNPLFPLAGFEDLEDAKEFCDRQENDGSDHLVVDINGVSRA